MCTPSLASACAALLRSALLAQRTEESARERREGLGGRRAASRGAGGRQTPGKQLLCPFRRERRCGSAARLVSKSALFIVRPVRTAKVTSVLLFGVWCFVSLVYCLGQQRGSARRAATRLTPRTHCPALVGPRLPHERQRVPRLPWAWKLTAGLELLSLKPGRVEWPRPLAAPGEGGRGEGSPHATYAEPALHRHRSTTAREQPEGCAANWEKLWKAVSSRGRVARRRRVLTARAHATHRETLPLRTRSRLALLRSALLCSALLAQPQRRRRERERERERRVWRERTACAHTRGLLRASATPHRTESIKKEMAQLTPHIHCPRYWTETAASWEQRTPRHSRTQRLAPSLRP